MLFIPNRKQSVLDNPTCFLNPLQFEITFECLQELDDGTLNAGSWFIDILKNVHLSF